MSLGKQGLRNEWERLHPLKAEQALVHRGTVASARGRAQSCREEKQHFRASLSVRPAIPHEAGSGA